MIGIVIQGQTVRETCGKGVIIGEEARRWGSNRDGFAERFVGTVSRVAGSISSSIAEAESNHSGSGAGERRWG